MIHKGALFWYKVKGKKYAALVLDEIGAGEYYFILLSEELVCYETVEDIFETPAYTAAWFSACNILPSIRMHLIADYYLHGCFNGYAGGFFSEHTVRINNCGQSKTWKHEYRQLSFHGKKMKEQINQSAYNVMYYD